MNAALANSDSSAMSQDEVWNTLTRFACDLGVSVEHVIQASLRTVAEEYKRSTGNGQIPAIF
jgi:hypothetical protein